MLKRLLIAMPLCLFLVIGVCADDYQGRVVKVEKDTLTLAITWRGVFPKGAKVDPPVKTDFMLDAKVKVFDFNVKEVKDEETRKRIMRVGEYVIVKTEKKDKKETAISIQTLPGAGPGGGGSPPKAEINDQEKKDVKGMEILYDPPEKLPKNVGRNGLCLDAPSMGGKSTRTDKTISALLGPDVQRIKIHYYSKKWDSFEKAKDHLIWMLAAKSQDGTMYRYQPWAEAASPCIIATIEYKKGKGELEMGGVGAHVCFQDEQGVHWWTRLPFSAVPFKK